MIKAVKILNLFSTLLFGAVLLVVYAYLPISVDLNAWGMDAVHKQSIFYYAIGGFVVVNFLLRIVTKVGVKSLRPLLQSWIGLIIFVLNFYFTTLIGFIGVWNNATHVAPSSYAYLNYIGPVMIIFWLVGLIFLAIKKS